MPNHFYTPWLVEFILLRTVYLYAGQSSSVDRILGSSNSGYFPNPGSKTL
jgi:hypothetical protein